MKTERINLRVTPEEKQKLQELADRAYLPLTGYIVSELLRGGEKMKKAEIRKELEELYKEMQELKEELQDYYHENSGFSNGADFSLGFASRSKHIRERIEELEADLNEYNKYWVVDISETVTETRYEGNNKAEAIKCGKDWVWRYPPTTNKIEVREIFPVEFDDDGEVVNYDYNILWESK